MANRTSADIFSTIFEHLSSKLREHETLDIKEFSDFLFRLAMKADFSFSQLECDEALIHLGLAKVGIDPDYPEDGECVIYG